MSYAKLLKKALDASGNTQDELSEESGVPQSTISRILSGKSSDPFIKTRRKLEAALGVTITVEDSNLQEAPVRRGRIPMISWVSAGLFSEVIDLYEPGYAEDWVDSFRPHSPGTFALRVKGDSMVSPNPLEQSFPHNCIILVDPERPVSSGSRVIARYKPTNEASFKVYIEDGERKFLRPLNPTYSPVELNHQYDLIGVVFEKIESV